MTETQLLSTGQAIVASCAVGWFFYALSWVLQQPFVWNRAAKWISHYKKMPKKDMDAVLSGVHVRVVGAVHNTIQVILCLYSLTNPALWEDVTHAITPLTQAIHIFSAGFFLWDIAVSIRHVSHDGPEFVVHGTLCFAFYFYITLTRKFHFFGCGYLLWELSTPFVHLRWLLYKIGLKDTNLYMCNGLLMMAAFGLCRICWGGYLSMKFFLMPTSQNDVSTTTVWVLRLMCTTLNGLNWYWFKQMIAAVVRLCAKKPPAEHQNLPPNGAKLKT